MFLRGKQGDAHGALRIHRARSSWSAEGRLITESAEALQLEPSWTGHAVRLEKFGQIGSMPVRGWFPFAAVEDTQAGVVRGEKGVNGRGPLGQVTASSYAIYDGGARAVFSGGVRSRIEQQ